ncbi:MAG: hypothetical protein LBL00_03505, partial [Endomicrobium sp.]|nr:hypothetical protein [Endomicrobium sp.]
EISAMSPDGRWIRVTGSLINVTDESKQQKFFDASPGLSDLYSGDKRKDFTILSFKEGIATIEGFSGGKEIIELK